jgi:hypothetical protein
MTLTPDALWILEATVEHHETPAADLRDLLRRLTGEGVLTTLTEAETLQQLGARLGVDRATILLGHTAAILAIYDDISLDGYGLEDAIQDFMEGKGT